VSDTMERVSVVDVVKELLTVHAGAVPVRTVLMSLINAGWTRDHAVAEVQSEVHAGHVHLNERFSLSL
jgi:hypothetical protein